MTDNLDTKSHKKFLIRKAAYIAILVNGVFGLFKTIGGFIFQSHALLADGLHSLSDLVVDFMVIIGGHWSHQDADEEHPYGHQRIETALTLLISLFLIFTGVAIALDAFKGLWHPILNKTSYQAFLLALASALANEGLFRYTHYLNQNIKTDLLDACAWHHRSDALSAAVVLVGILGNMMGIRALDHLAAIAIGVMIIKMGWDYSWNSIQQLIDRGVSPEIYEDIINCIYDTAGVEKIHQLRTRMMGQDIFVDVHVLVDPFISVSAGHYIAQDVHHRLLQKLPKIKDVTVHIDPEDDEDGNPNMHLPNSHEIAEELIKKWRKVQPMIVDWSAHYLKGEIQIDLVLNHELNDPDTFIAQVQRACHQKKWPIRTIRLLRENQSIAILLDK
jgi:cation diffusion facilitator family transporter